MPALLLTLLLAACQISHTVEIRDARTVTVLMEGGDTHSRGGQATEVGTEVGLAP